VERRKKPERKSRKPIYAVVAVVIVFFCILTYSFLHPTYQTNISQEFSYKAAIVDHLSLSQPNEAFVETAINTLETANYTVDYYPGEKVNVEFYRNLPTHGYSIIVLRVHSVAGTFEGKPYVLFFTSERFSRTKYVPEQLTDQVGWVGYYEGGPIYFGISGEFVRLGMNGRFNNTIIIMMGCEGLTYNTMAEAFIEKGAKVYISWNGSVSASHTDQATTQLLKHLITEKQTIKQAVTETMKEVGPDSESGSVLRDYPDT